MTSDGYWFSFGEDGVPPGLAGAEAVRVRWVWTLADDFNGISGQTVESGAWGPGLDPLVDRPDGCLPPIRLAAQRLDVEAPPAHCQ